jgi:phage terminase large subunit-like protein
MKQAERVTKFIEQFCTLSGSFRGQPFILADFQKDIIETIFAEDETGRRKIRSAVVLLPRKNGKSLLSACIAVYMLIADDRDPMPLVVCAASDRQQARLVHDECKRLIQDSEELNSVCTIQRNQIMCHRNNGVLKVVSADAGSAQGLNSSALIFDEAHVFKNDDLYQALTLGSAARNEPLFVSISTCGYDLTSPLGRQYTYGLKVNSGEVKDDSFAMIHYGPPLNSEFDPDDPEVWKACNPAWDWLNHEEFHAAHRSTPKAAWIRFRLNGWTKTENHWLPQGAFDACKTKRRLEPGEPVVLGFDGSWSGDSTALVACTLDEPKHVELVGLWERPLDQHAQGWRVNVDDVCRTIREAADKYNCVEIACDPYRWELVLYQLAEEGLPIVEYPTNAISRSTAATQILYDLIVDKRITFADNQAALQRHFENAVLKEDARGARLSKPGQRGHPQKIDAAVATMIAVHRAHARREEEPEYHEPQLLVV